MPRPRRHPLDRATVRVVTYVPPSLADWIAAQAEADYRSPSEWLRRHLEQLRQRDASSEQLPTPEPT